MSDLLRNAPVCVGAGLHPDRAGATPGSHPFNQSISAFDRIRCGWNENLHPHTHRPPPDKIGRPRRRRLPVCRSRKTTSRSLTSTRVDLYRCRGQACKYGYKKSVLEGLSFRRSETVDSSRRLPMFSITKSKTCLWLSMRTPPKFISVPPCTD